MDLVNVDRRVKAVVTVPLRHPFLITPGVGHVPYQRDGERRHLVQEANRIGLVDAIIVVLRDKMVLVDVAGLDSFNDALPDARLGARPQLVLSLVPVVEVSNYRYLARVRRPDREGGTNDLVVLHNGMCPEFVVKLKMVAFVEEINVLLGKQGGARSEE